MNRDGVPDTDDDFGGETKAHYGAPLPPRAPAATPEAPYKPAIYEAVRDLPLDAFEQTFAARHNMIGSPFQELRATMIRHNEDTCPVCCIAAARMRATIAEMFQEPLRRAYFAAAQTVARRAGLVIEHEQTEREFQAWYAHEVLR